MSAATVTTSPTQRLGAYRPASMTGESGRMRMRGGAWLRLAAGIPARSIRHGPPMKLLRSSGVQLHPTSLPAGRLGAEAYAFVDWLADAGQSWWQMLPLGPPDRYGSPYKAKSAFAAWPGLLADPKAKGTREEELDFRQRNGYWIDDWARAGGSVADQVRF